MSLSYLVMLIAFYVDNGKRLPIWRDLPPATYWPLPLVVAAPLLLRALALPSLGARPAFMSTPDPSGTRRFIWSIVAVQMLVQIGAFSLPALLPTYIDAWHLTKTQAGSLVGIF